MTAVAIHNLVKRYPGNPAAVLDQLSLEIRDGELLALLGPSGCGKSTMLNIIAGLVDPTSGEITFDNQSIVDLKPERRGSVLMFQRHLLFPHMTVADNVSFGLRMRGVPKSIHGPRVAAMLERVQLTGMENRLPSSLSGGQQQRVALARALIVAPKVLLMDEPLSSLDAALREDMRELINTLQREFRITTIVVTHDREEAFTLGDRIALLLDGRIHQLGDPRTLYRTPVDERAARFFGGRNFIQGNSDGRTFFCAAGNFQLPQGAPTGQRLLTIRPEDIRLEQGPSNNIVASVAECSDLGAITRLRLEVNGLSLECHSHAEGKFYRGMTVSITLPRERLWLLPLSQ